MSNKTISKIVTLLVVTLVLMYLGRHSQFSQYFGLEYLERTIRNTGMFGIVFFTVVYVVGTLMNIPGMIFLFVLFLVYDGLDGFIIAYATTLLAMLSHFFFTRSFTGKVLSEIEHPIVKKYVKKIADKPLKTTIILRLLLFISPPVNYALAFSPIKLRYFIAGSMIAMPFNILLNYGLTIYAKDWMMSCFG